MSYTKSPPWKWKRKNAFRYECNKRTENVIKEHEMVVKIIFKNSAVKNARAQPKLL